MAQGARALAAPPGTPVFALEVPEERRESLWNLRACRQCLERNADKPSFQARLALMMEKTKPKRINLFVVLHGKKVLYSAEQRDELFDQLGIEANDPARLKGAEQHTTSNAPPSPERPLGAAAGAAAPHRRPLPAFPARRVLIYEQRIFPDLPFTHWSLNVLAIEPGMSSEALVAVLNRSLSVSQVPSLELHSTPSQPRCRAAIGS